MIKADEDALETIIADFIRSMLKNEMDDENSYVELKKRIECLIDMEFLCKLGAAQRR